MFLTHEQKGMDLETSQVQYDTVLIMAKTKMTISIMMRMRMMTMQAFGGWSGRLDC